MSQSVALDSLTGITLAEKYRLVKVLGSGAMGHVYQAEQVGLGRAVAVKILRGGLAANPSSIDRFRTEALAASRINHPNAIAIFDFGVTPEGIPYLVMEYLRGRTLAALIDEHPFAPARVVQVGAQILSAVEEAHHCGVIHRDLKSENVMVESLRDGTDFVKVLDFGVARLADKPQAENLVSGTPEYMAPEQIRGETVIPSSDLYAVGVVLYEMVVGRTPFSGAPTMVVLDRHLNEEPIPPQQIIPSCPIGLSDVIMKSLLKDSKERYQNAADMRAALLAALDGAQQLVCSTCGTRAAAGMRFCSTCGAQLNVRATGTMPTLESEQAPATGEQPRTTLQGVPRRSVSKPRIETAPTLSSVGQATAHVSRGHTSRLTRDLPRPSVGFIGRVEETERIALFVRGAVAQATFGIIGPPGIGKSRLVLEVAKNLANEAVTFVAGPDPSGFQMPWYPILSMLEAVLGLTSVPTIEELSEAVARCGLPERDVPGLAEAFALRGPLAPLELAARRRETVAACMRALRAAGKRFHRVVLCFVDVDRYDRPSRQLLSALSEGLDGSGPRLVVTSGNADSVPVGAAVLHLTGLSPDDSALLLTGMMSRGTIPPADVVHALTGGSPAAVEQLGGWISIGNDIGSAPPRLVDLVSARVGMLSATERRVLQVIAAQGQVAQRSRVASAMVEIDPDGAAVSSLSRAGLMLVDDFEVKIPFDLVASVVAMSTPADVRRALSAEALANFDENVHPGIIGHHAEVIGDLARSISCYVAAGDDGVRRFDDQGAGAWYSRAIAAARRLVASGDQAGSTWHVEASIRLADVLRYVGEVRLAAGCLDEAALSDPDAIQQAGILRARGRISLSSGDVRGAVALLQRSLGLALRAGDRDFLCETYVDLAQALTNMGNAKGAVSELAEAIDLITLGDGLADATGPPKLWLLGFRMAELQLRVGDAAGAERTAQGALQFARQLGNVTGQGRLHALLASIVEAAGDAQRALVHRAHALDHLRRLGDRRSTAELLIACARATDDLPPVIASQGAADRSRLTAKRAMQIAHDLAVEVGWDEGIAMTRTTSSSDTH